MDTLYDKLFASYGSDAMINFRYTIDGTQTDVDEFRAHPHRVEAEEHLVGAYQQVIGHMICAEHKQASGYELRFISATGECKISTLACCPEFDARLNNALIQSIAENDRDE